MGALCCAHLDRRCAPCNGAGLAYHPRRQASVPGEVAGLRKDELNERDALWTIPATRYKTGHEQVVPLAPLALELIRAASAFNAGVPDAFPSPQQRCVPCPAPLH